MNANSFVIIKNLLREEAKKKGTINQIYPTMRFEEFDRFHGYKALFDELIECYHKYY